MNITIKARLWACGILLASCLVTSVFNFKAVATVINFLTFLSATIVLLVELKRISKGTYLRSVVTNTSFGMLGCALMAGASLVGGILDTDVVDGFSLVVDVNGQVQEVGGRRIADDSNTGVFTMISYMCWLFSIVAFLSCSILTHAEEVRRKKQTGA